MVFVPLLLWLMAAKKLISWKFSMNMAFWRHFLLQSHQKCWIYLKFHYNYLFATVSHVTHGCKPKIIDEICWLLKLRICLWRKPVKANIVSPFHSAWPLGQAESWYWCVCLFVCVCVCVCPQPPQEPGPLATFWIPWTFRYLLDTLNGDEDEDEDENENENEDEDEDGM